MKPAVFFKEVTLYMERLVQVVSDLSATSCENKREYQGTNFFAEVISDCQLHNNQAVT